MLRAPTPPDRLTDHRGRPYFIWDVDISLSDWLRAIRDPDAERADYWLARALRDAKPDDVLEWVSLDEIAQRWNGLAPFVGRQRGFWLWWLERTDHALPT